VFFAQEEGPTLVATAQALFPRWAPFILTGLLASLRWGESAALYRTDIDSTRGRLHVQRTFSEKANSIQRWKDGDDRWVKASPALLAALRGHLAADGPRGSGQGVDPPEQRKLAFPTTVGRIIHYGQFLENVWQPLLAKAGLPYRKYHSTRHTFATWLSSDGADLRADADGPRLDRPDGRHLRSRPARAPRSGRGRPRSLPKCLGAQLLGASRMNLAVRPIV
jgi:integrase